MIRGKIVQVSGPVVDVLFESEHMPKLRDALNVKVDGNDLTMEVAQILGQGTVRCIVLGSSEGLARNMEVVSTGTGISVPVGDATIGRMFNVLGDPLEEKLFLSHRQDGIFTDLLQSLKTKMYLLRYLKQELKL